MIKDIIDFFVTYSELLLSVITAIILLLMFYIKKKIKLRRLKKMRTKEYFLTESEAMIIDSMRLKEAQKMQEEDDLELAKILKLITPEAIDLIKKLPIFKKILSRNDFVSLPKPLEDLKNLVESDSD